jgi:DNA-binding CsgD family transcriptional regulator
MGFVKSHIEHALPVTMGYSVNLIIIYLLTRSVQMTVLGHASQGFESAAPELLFSIGYTLGFFTVFLRGLLKTQLRFGVLLLCSGCFLGGTILLGSTMFGNIFPDGAWVPLVGMFLFGVGAALSFSLWQQCLSSHESRAVAWIVALGSIAAYVVLIPSFYCPAHVVFLLLCLFITVDVGLLYSYCRKIRKNESKKDRLILMYGTKTMRRLLKSVWKYGLCIGVLGLAQRVAASMVGGFVDPSKLFIAYSITAVAATVAALVFADRHRFGISFNSFYSAMVTAVALMFVGLFFFGWHYAVLVAVASNVAFMLASLFMVVASISIAKSRDVNPSLLFGLLAGMVFAIATTGSAMFPLLDTFQNAKGLSSIVVGSILVIYSLTFAGSCLLFQGRKPTTEELDFELEPSTEEDSILSLNAPSEKFIQDETIHQDFIPACCDVLRKEYSLTERQTEVLELIARGRDVTRIADALCVSYNTARSHCRNLYAKLGIHKRQEILDMLEKTKRTL